jgi:hypothetical protein
MAPMASRHHLEASADVDVATLVYELLDAHADTALLAAETDRLGDDERWRAHVDYLQALQRVGREVLARVAAPHAG